MSDDSDHAQRSTKLRSVGLAAIIFVLIICTGLGSVLVNVDWPGGGFAWLRVAFGAVLLTLALLSGELLVRVILEIRRGSPNSAPTKNLDLVDRLGGALARPKRIFAVLALVPTWFLVAVLVPPVFKPPPIEPLLEPGELVIMSAIDESPSDPRQLLFEQWNRAHPENPVRVENVSGEPDAQHRGMVADASGDSEDATDIYLLDVVWMTEFIERRYLRPLDESRLSTGDFLDNVLDTCRDQYGDPDNGLWALPFNSDAGLLYYRNNVPGITRPTSWDAIFGASAKSTFVAAKNTPGNEGIGGKLKGANAAQFANEEVLTVNAFEAMWAAGGEVVNRDGNLVFDRNAVAFDANALEGLKKLAAAYRDQGIVLPDSGDTDEGKATTAFKNEQALFMRNWPVAYDELRSSNDQNAVSFDVARLPGDSVLGGQNLAISRWTDKPRAAQAFIEFLTSSASQLILFETGGFAPTRNSAYDNASRPYKDDLRGVVASARPRPFLPHYTEFSQEFRLGITRALNNNGELEEGFATKLAEIANRK